MKKLLIILVLFFATFTMFGQSVNKGLNFGVGLDGNGLPVYANYDIPVTANLAVAPSVQFNLAGFDWVSPGVKVDYYFDDLLGLPAEFDVYGGGNIGFVIYLDNDNGTSGLSMGAEIGGRWWFQENMGLNVEVSGGLGFGTKVGLSMKM